MAGRIVKSIGTHSGTFHADEAMACYLLRTLDQFSGAKITRSRDPDVLSQLDCLVDVGSEYDPARLRFDHHQRSFTETFSPKHNIRLSSAGLIYKHYGVEVIKNITHLDDAKAKTVFDHVYDSLIMSMDAIDNGVQQYPPESVPRYRDSTSVASRVGRLNPSWNEKVDDDELMVRFEKAIAICGAEFEDHVKSAAFSWLPALEIVRSAIAKRFEVNPSGEVFVLEEFAPWKDIFFTVEKEETEEEAAKPTSLKNCKFVIYPAESGGWRYQAIPVHPSSFEQRFKFPSEWFGLRDSELDALTGVEPGAVFVHHTGFTGGHKTRSGVEAMVNKALEVGKASSA